MVNQILPLQLNIEDAITTIALAVELLTAEHPTDPQRGNRSQHSHPLHCAGVFLIGWILSRLLGEQNRSFTTGIA